MSTAQDELIAYLATRRHQEPDGLSLARIAQPFAVFAVLVGICMAWNMLPRRGYKADPAGLAQLMAERFVKQELRSPSTANFPATAEVRQVGGAWLVSSYVDAQNGFGATIRNHWTAELRDHGSQWELVKLDWNKQ
jgi:hypothetical protein